MTMHLIPKFAKMGASLTLGPEGRPRDPRGRPRLGFTIDVVEPAKGQESFWLNAGPDVETHVLDLQPQDRHLLLLARNIESGELIGKYLCGHDERHWFVAGVGRQATSVRTAKEALKPFAVRQAEKSVRSKNRQRRKNKARQRQGEWFFLPAPQLAAGGQIVLRNEPLRRGAGKPHMAEELVRFGGGARIPGYGAWKEKTGGTPEAYSREVVEGRIFDPVLGPFLKFGTRFDCVVPGYIPDPASLDYGVSVIWERGMD